MHIKCIRKTYKEGTTEGRAMTHAVSCWPLTAEARVRARIILCVICGGKSDTGTGFSPRSSVFPCQYQSTVALHTHLYFGGYTIGPLVAAGQRHLLPPST
jgi:hypothetical protein